MRAEGFDRATDLALAAGCSGVEILEVQGAPPVVPDVEAARRYKKILDEKGLSLVCFSTGTSLVLPEAETHDTESAVQFLIKYIEIAKIFETPYFHHTLIPQLNYDEKTYVRDFDGILEKLLPPASRVADECERQGLTVLYEPQGAYVNGKENFSKFYYAMKNAGKKVGVCGDMSNTMYFDWKPEDFFDSFKHEIKHLHIKNSRYFSPEETTMRLRYTICGKYLAQTPLSEGDVDLSYCIDRVKAVGYNGNISIERNYTDFLSQAPDDVKLIKEMI